MKKIIMTIKCTDEYLITQKEILDDDIRSCNEMNNCDYLKEKGFISSTIFVEDCEE